MRIKLLLTLLILAALGLALLGLVLGMTHKQKENGR